MLQDRLFANLRTSLPGALDAAISYALYDVIKDACDKGLIWRETIEVPLVVNQRSYVLAVSGADVKSIVTLSHDKFNLSGSAFENGTLTFTDYPTTADTALPVYATVQLSPILGVSHDPASVEGWIPGDLWTTHYEMFMAGVLARMMIQPAKPYSNPQMAAMYETRYRSDRAVARRKVQTGGAESGQMWHYPRHTR